MSSWRVGFLTVACLLAVRYTEFYPNCPSLRSIRVNPQHVELFPRRILPNTRARRSIRSLRRQATNARHPFTQECPTVRLHAPLASKSISPATLEALSLAATHNTSYLRVHTRLDVNCLDDRSLFCLLSSLVDHPDYHNDYMFAWSSSQNNRSFIGIGGLGSIDARGSTRFTSVRKGARSMRSRVVDTSPDCTGQLSVDVDSTDVPLLCGGFSFAASDGDRDGPWEGFPDGRFWVPRLLMHKEGGGGEDVGWKGVVTVRVDKREDGREVEARVRKEIQGLEALINKSNHPKSNRDVRRRDPVTPQDTEEESKNSERRYESWINLISKAIQYMNLGNMSKVVLARCVPYTPPGAINVSSTLSSLSASFPECCTFFIKLPRRPAFLGATPERLIRLRGTRMETEALAGTIGRGRNADEDMENGAKLLASLKDRKEHQLVVDEIRGLLAPISRNLNIPPVPSVRKLKNVFHLETNIEAELRDDAELFDLVEKLHPTPALGGTPRDVALKWMAKNEGWERGWYAAPIGWSDREGNGEFVVAIRSALISEQDSKVWLFSGCGIVPGSNPESEWEETNVKLRAMLEALRADSEA
ncbi:hypothetical protein AAMO2058_001453700 [Amorphochlora amoebiformis]